MLGFLFLMLYRLSMELDTLSSVLMRLRLKTTFQNAFDAAGRWGIEVPAHRGIKIHTVLKGRCWITVADDPTPKELTGGDCYLLPRGNSFVIGADPSIFEKRPVKQVVERNSRGIDTYNGGGECLVSGVFFDFESSLSDVFFRSLPGIVIVPGATNQATGLQLNIQRFAAEFHGSAIGRSLIMYQLAPIILLDIIRTHLSKDPNNSTWFGALTDGNLSRVLRLMHTEYGHRWTLEDLARSAGLSRSKLAAEFKSRVGVAPMEYLCRWRMEIARDLLSGGEHTISEVSQMVGYESESAFSAAFTRVLKNRPGHYRKRQSGTADLM
jgi:AraC-like DNA-binding protein